MITDPEAVGKLIREVTAAEILPRFRNLTADEISKKSAGDVVTVADIAAEAALAAGLSEIMPGAHIVGEEAAENSPESLNVLAGDDPVWIIDPVDGTQNFADGKDCFAVIVAWVEGGLTTAGWIYEPVSDAMVWAGKGRGTWIDGKQVKYADAGPINTLRGSLKDHIAERMRRKHGADKSNLPADIVRYRCVGAEYADLARCNLHFARYGGRLKPWDHAAGVLIHDEASGFSAVCETQKPYQVTPDLEQQTLLMAPSDDSWRQLNNLLA